MADKQQKRVYKWESTWGVWNGPSSKDGCRYWLEWACTQYGVEIPKLVFAKNNRGWSYYQEDKDTIRLVKDHQNFSVVFHESAHAIASFYYPRAIEDHGPEWLGIFLWLLRESKAVPEVALKASAKEFGLKWKALDASSPDALKAVAKRKGPRRGLETLALGTDLD
jgi:hypothetical protein